MGKAGSPGSVVVGVDGSRAAIAAAKWAVVEAVSRNVPLRLVHVAAEPAGPSDALRDASAAIAATGQPVTVETATLSGRADAALIEESLGAAMICVGSTGIGRMARMLLGSTAGALAERAHCPVAVIRADSASRPLEGGPIAVTLNDDFDNDAVVHLAMQEALLRGAPVLALGAQSRLSRWAQRYPDVDVQTVDAGSEVAGYLETTDEPIRFIVLGHGDIHDVPRIIGPHNRPGCSVLVVRQ